MMYQIDNTFYVHDYNFDKASFALSFAHRGESTDNSHFWVECPNEGLHADIFHYVDKKLDGVKVAINLHIDADFEDGKMIFAQIVGIGWKRKGAIQLASQYEDSMDCA